jgi:hypothetical protein
LAHARGDVQQLAVGVDRNFVAKPSLRIKVKRSQHLELRDRVLKQEDIFPRGGCAIGFPHHVQSAAVGGNTMSHVIAGTAPQRRGNDGARRGMDLQHDGILAAGALALGVADGVEVIFHSHDRIQFVGVAACPQDLRPQDGSCRVVLDDQVLLGSVDVGRLVRCPHRIQGAVE